MSNKAGTSHFVYEAGCDRDVGGRSTAQAIALKKHLPVDMVMNLDVPRQVIMDRLTDRWIHPGSGRVYAYAYRPPKVCWFRVYVGYKQRSVAFSVVILSSIHVTVDEATQHK